MDVSVSGFGSNDKVATQVDPTCAAIRTSVRPLEYQPDQGIGGVVGGHYQIATVSGLIAAGIASLAQVFQVRWADPTKIFILKKLVVMCATATGFAATTLGAPLDFILGHGSTANGSGGTALAPTGSSNKLRAAMGTTGFATSGEIRIATTAALTAATGQTLEPAALASCMGADNRTLVSTGPMNLFEQRDAGDHPLILNTGDTFAIRAVTPAATGTWYLSVTMGWAEAGVY